MSNYNITCVNKSAPGYAGHGHIVSVGIGNNTVLSVAQVYERMRANDRFYTYGATSRQIAWVEPYTCCGVQTLRTNADRTADNNLDNLRPCY